MRCIVLIVVFGHSILPVYASAQVILPDQEIITYTEQIRENPVRHEAYFYRGKAWTAKKEFDKAIADFNVVIELTPKNACGYDARGAVWFKKKEYSKAIADFNKGAELQPQDATAFMMRAWLWATCTDVEYRDGKRAVESATHGCELAEWKNLLFLEILAASYAETGNFDKAVEYEAKALALCTDNKDKALCESRLTLYRGKKPFRLEGIAE